MAEFGYQATTLPQPSGAASVAPVNPAVSRFDIPQGLLNLGGQYVEERAKEESKRVNPNIAKYNREMGRLHNAIESGEITSSEANTRRRVYTAQAISGSGGDVDAIEAIKKISAGYTGSTLFEEVEETRKFSNEMWEDAVGVLSERGINVPASATDEQRQTYIDIANQYRSQSSKLDRDLKTLNLASSELSYGKSVQEEALAASLNKFVESQVPLTMEMIDLQYQTLSQSIERGESSFQDAEFALRRSIEPSLAALSQMQGVDPATVGAVTKFVTDSLDSRIKMLDPSTSADERENLLRLQRAQDTALLRYDGKVRALDSLQKMIGPNAISTFVSSELAIDTINRFDLAVSSVDRRGAYEEFTGKASAVRTETLQTLSLGIKNMFGEGRADRETAQYVNNTVNSVLAGWAGSATTGSTGASVANATEVVNFLASNDFAMWVKSSEGLDPDALEGAKRAFDSVYLSEIQNPINNKLFTPVRGFQHPSLEHAEINFIDIAMPRFTGNGVQFDYVEREGVTFSQSNAAKYVIDEMNSTTRTLNMLIRAGANLAGEPSIEKYWESNKHNILPAFFSNTLKEGHVEDGKVYLGGPPSSKYSWGDQPDGR